MDPVMEPIAGINSTEAMFAYVSVPLTENTSREPGSKVSQKVAGRLRILHR